MTLNNKDNILIEILDSMQIRIEADSRFIEAELQYESNNIAFCSLVFLLLSIFITTLNIIILS